MITLGKLNKLELFVSYDVNIDMRLIIQETVLLLVFMVGCCTQKKTILINFY